MHRSSTVLFGHHRASSPSTLQPNYVTLRLVKVVSHLSQYSYHRQKGRLTAKMTVLQKHSRRMNSTKWFGLKNQYLYLASYFSLRKRPLWSIPFSTESTLQMWLARIWGQQHSTYGIQYRKNEYHLKGYREVDTFWAWGRMEGINLRSASRRASVLTPVIIREIHDQQLLDQSLKSQIKADLRLTNLDLKKPLQHGHMIDLWMVLCIFTKGWGYHGRALQASQVEIITSSTRTVGEVEGKANEGTWLVEQPNDDGGE